jgi:predicted nucleic acid-binding Zn ribbon protein
MPTYEFQLPDGTIIERSFKISEVPDQIPNPNGEGVAQRIISGGAGLLFKGTGFYLTDYGRNAHRTQGDAPKPAKEGSASSDSASTSTKSESAGSTASSDAKTASTPKAETKSSASSGPATT